MSKSHEVRELPVDGDGATSKSETSKSPPIVNVMADEKASGGPDASTARGSTGRSDPEKNARGVDLARINTSASTVEYPTGIKLALISLALCLRWVCIAAQVERYADDLCSVFLVALDNTIIVGFSILSLSFFLSFFPSSSNSTLPASINILTYSIGYCYSQDH